MSDEDAMYGAIARGDTNTVRQLIAASPKILQSFLIDKSWLHWAAQDGHSEIMAVLVGAGMPIDQLTQDGTSTPLEVAAGQGHYKACEWLLDHGADVNYWLGKSATPIFAAIYSKSLALVELFVKRGADLSATFGDPKIDVITYAESYGTSEIVTFLRKAGSHHDF